MTQICINIEGEQFLMPFSNDYRKKGEFTHDDLVTLKIRNDFKKGVNKFY